MCDGNPVIVTVSVAEPSTIVMALIGIPGMIVVTARHRSAGLRVFANNPRDRSGSASAHT